MDCEDIMKHYGKMVEITFKNGSDSYIKYGQTITGTLTDVQDGDFGVENITEQYGDKKITIPDQIVKMGVHITDVGKRMQKEQLTDEQINLLKNEGFYCKDVESIKPVD